MRRNDAALISTVRQRAPAQYQSLPPALKLGALTTEAEARAVESLNDASGSRQATQARARCRTLAARSETDLRLCRDAALAAGIAPGQLARINRARREMNDLLSELEQ